MSAISQSFPTVSLTLPWSYFCDILTRLKPYSKRTIVCWNFPEVGSLKLNTDGSFILSSVKAGIGGVLRDDKGDFVLAFSSPIRCDSDLEAEAMAARYGLSRCIQLNYRNFTLEVDSICIAQMVNDNKSYNYKLNLIIEEIQHLKKLANVTVEHCFREANRVADCLAKLAVDNQNESFYDSYQQLPVGAKGPFQLDKSQMPSIRLKYDKANFFVS